MTGSDHRMVPRPHASLFGKRGSRVRITNDGPTPELTGSLGCAREDEGAIAAAAISAAARFRAHPKAKELQALYRSSAVLA